MANQIPDFTNKQPMIDPMAIANILQRRSEIEYKQRQDAQNRRDNLLAGIAPAIEAGQHIASTMMDLAAKRNQAKGLKDLTNLMATPEPTAPAPTASSTAVPEAGTFGVQPSPEQTQGYQNRLLERQQALTTALAQANPEKFTEYAAKGLFKEPKAIDLEQKEVLSGGSPTLALFDKNSGNYYDSNTKQRLTDVKPYSPSQDTELTDKDRTELTPLAQSIIEGRATPNALVSARGARKEKLSRVVAELDPSFDLSLAPQRMAMRKEYTPAGKSGQALTSLNTVIGHLDTLSSKLDKLDNQQITKYNSIQNYVKNNIGKPEVKEFVATKNLVASELGKIAQGSGVVTNEERKQFDNDLSASSSPAQVKGVISTYMDLMKSRTDALKANWNQTMSAVQPPIPFINDKSKKILVKNGYNPDTLEKQGAGQSNDKVDAFFQSLLNK